MLPGAPRCYYDFRSSVAELTLGAVASVTEAVRRAFGVEAELPEGVRLVIQEGPALVLLPSGRVVLGRGGYDPLRRELRLIGDAWCWKTLVHEVLHALSAFFRVEDLVVRSLVEWRSVVEGLTEFLTGYVLYEGRARGPGGAASTGSRRPTLPARSPTSRT